MDVSTLLELEPVALEDNTEIKVPFISTVQSEEDDLNLSGVVKEDLFLNEYTRLVTWYRDLPEGMFVSRVLREYASSEVDLEETRQMFFLALKAYDDFPFGLQAEMKRRVATRRGEKLEVKLATDIYKLVSVMEGEDYNDLKELLSNGKPRYSQSQTPLSTTGKLTKNAPGCSITDAEFSLLKDSISSVQTDVLHIKQTMQAAEKLRVEQIKTISSAVETIKGDLLQCNNAIANCMRSVQHQMTADIQRVILTVQSSTLAMANRICKLESFLSRPKVVQENISPSFTPYTADVSNSQYLPAALSSTIQHDVTSAERVGGSENRRPKEQREDVVRVCPPVQGVLNERQICLNEITSSISESDCTANTPEVYSIPVIITRHDFTKEEEGFKTHTRRKTKRFFVSGYTSSVSTQEIANLVNNKGLSVTNIRKFPIRRSPNSVIFRLNVEGNEKADLVLDDGFWPSGIVCKPWMSRDALWKERQGRRHLTQWSRDWSQGNTRKHDIDSSLTMNVVTMVNIRTLVIVLLKLIMPIKFMTWNATGLISSSSYLCDSLEKYDIDICGISEHYLYPQNVHFIETLNTNYHVHVVCDKDLSYPGNWRVGKGGVALMWHKRYEHCVVPLTIDDDRLIGVQFQVAPNQYLFIFQVYMPCVNYTAEYYKRDTTCVPTFTVHSFIFRGQIL